MMTFDTTGDLFSGGIGIVNFTVIMNAASTFSSVHHLSTVYKQQLSLGVDRALR